MDKVLYNRPLNISDLSGMLDRSGKEGKSGAESIFIGKVRADVVGDSLVEAIEYSAYEEMVQSEAAQIKEAVLEAYPDVQEVDMRHATGRVAVGEWSLLVVVCGGHRDEAGKACREILERIKKKLPIWKKEILQKGGGRWKDQ